MSILKIELGDRVAMILDFPSQGYIYGEVIELIDGGYVLVEWDGDIEANTTPYTPVVPSEKAGAYLVSPGRF